MCGKSEWGQALVAQSGRYSNNYTGQRGRAEIAVHNVGRPTKMVSAHEEASRETHASVDSHLPKTETLIR